MPFLYTEQIQVRFADLDPYAHVNNSVYLSYFEIARTNAILDLFNQMTKQGVQIVLTESTCAYKQPVTLETPCFVTVEQDDMGRAWFSLKYTVHNNNGTTFATGTTKHCLVKGDTGRVMRLTQDFIDLLS